MVLAKIISPNESAVVALTASCAPGFTSLIWLKATIAGSAIPSSMNAVFSVASEERLPAVVTKCQP